MPATVSAQQINDLIDYWSRYHDIDPRLARAVFTQESGLNPNIPDSKTGAQGLAQIMPETQKLLGVTDPYDVNQSIRGGVAYLQAGLINAINSGAANPAAEAVRHYNPGGGADYINAVAKHYAALGQPPPTSAGQPSPASSGQPSPASSGQPPPASSPDLVSSPIQPVWTGSQWQSRTRPAAPPPEAAATAAPPPGGAPTARWAIDPKLSGEALSRVDPRLVDVLTQASGYLPPGWSVQMFSGYRAGDPRFHGQGQAADVRLLDNEGNQVPSYQNAGTFRMYEEYAQAAKAIQAKLYPELSDKFSWGGYFLDGGRQADGSLRYGAQDLEHFDLGGVRGLAGNWEGGLNEAGRAAGFDRLGGASVGMGDIASYRLPGQGNVAVAATPSSGGGGVVATSLPDQPIASDRNPSSIP